MVNPIAAIGAATAVLSLARARKERERASELQQQLENEQVVEVETGEIVLSDPDREVQMRQKDSLQRLVELEERNKPLPESHDATQSGSVDLDPGEEAIIEATPANGYVLQVDRVYADRRDDHDYEITIDGIDVASIHEWTGNPSRRVSESGTVRLTILNESGSTSTIDWVMDMYGHESEVAP